MSLRVCQEIKIPVLQHLLLILLILSFFQCSSPLFLSFHSILCLNVHSDFESDSVLAMGVERVSFNKRWGTGGGLVLKVRDLVVGGWVDQILLDVLKIYTLQSGGGS